MKKAKLILGTMAPIAGLSTILPIVACNKHEQDKIIPIPIDEYIIENGIIKGLKQQWSAYKKYTQILIPANVYSIANNALASNEKNGQIPKSIKYLAFEESQGYRDEQLIINDGAFLDDYSIKKISFPKRTQYIGELAFKGCSGVEVLDFSSWDAKRASEFNPFANFSIFDGWKDKGKVICSNETVRDSLFYMLTSLGLSEKWFTGVSYVTKAITDESNVNLNYHVINNEYAVITGITYSGTVLDDWTVPTVLPNGENGDVDVLGIAPAAATYKMENIKKVIIGQSSLKSIGAAAFAFCDGLEEVDLSNSNVEFIDSNAFIHCSDLKSISFPTTLRSIGSYCFAHNFALESIDLSNNEHITKIMPGTFYDCVNLKECKFYNNIINWIGSYAFALQYFSTTTGFAGEFPFRNARYIGDNAFENQGFSGIGFGGFATLEYLGDFAFKGCQNMTSIIINSSYIQYFGPGALSHMPKLTTISGNDIGPNYIVRHNAVFYREDGDLATKIVATCSGSTISGFAAEQIKEICPYAFAGIDLGQNLSNVLDLSSLNSLTTIGKYAFADLVGSASGEPHDIAIKLPSSVTTIGDYAFAGSNVANTGFIFSLHFLTSWGSYMFSNCPFIKTYSTRLETAIPEGTFADCTNLKTVSISPQIKYIGDRAFWNNTSLSTLNLTGFTSVPTSWYHEGEKPFNLSLTSVGQLTIGIKTGLKESWAKLLGQLGINEQVEGGINWSEVK